MGQFIGRQYVPTFLFPAYVNFRLETVLRTTLHTNEILTTFEGYIMTIRYKLVTLLLLPSSNARHCELEL